MFLITGAPKSGISLLSRALTQHPDVDILHDVFVGSLDCTESSLREEQRALQDHGFTDDKVASYRNFVQASGDPEAFGAVASSIVASFGADTNANHIGLAHPLYCLMLEEWLKYFPELKVIYVTRDPRAIYRSWKDDKAIATEYEALGIINLVTMLDGELARVMDAHHDRLRVVSYETLVTKQMGVLHELWSWLGCDPKMATSEYMEIADMYPARWPASLEPGINPNHLMSWELQITEKVFRDVTAKADTYCRRWNYPLASEGKALRRSPATLLQAFIDGKVLLPAERDTVRKEVALLQQIVIDTVSTTEMLARQLDEDSHRHINDVLGSDWKSYYNLGRSSMQMELGTTMQHLVHSLYWEAMR